MLELEKRITSWLQSRYLHIFSKGRMTIVAEDCFIDWCKKYKDFFFSTYLVTKFDYGAQPMARVYQKR